MIAAILILAAFAYSALAFMVWSCCAAAKRADIQTEKMLHGRNVVQFRRKARG